MEAWVDMLCLLTQPKEGQQQTAKRKVTKTVRKSNCMESNNKGVKEDILIQIGRRGGDGHPGRRGHAARPWLADQVITHLHAVKPEGTTGE